MRRRGCQNDSERPSQGAWERAGNSSVFLRLLIWNHSFFFYHHCLSSAFSKTSNLSLFISLLESKDMEKPEPENKGFVPFLSLAEQPPQEAKRAGSSITGTVPSVCPREREVSLARTLLHRPTAVRVQDDFSRWSCCAATGLIQW